MIRTYPCDLILTCLLLESLYPNSHWGVRTSTYDLGDAIQGLRRPLGEPQMAEKGRALKEDINIFLFQHLFQNKYLQKPESASWYRSKLNAFFFKWVERCRRKTDIMEGEKEKWGVKWYIHRLFWQRPVASSYIVDSQNLARYKRGQGPKYINGLAMASDRVIIGWEKGLTLQFHKLRSLGLMPFSEDLHGKDQVIASHWPRPELDISLWSFGERSVLRNKRKALKGEPALSNSKHERREPPPPSTFHKGGW